MKEKAVTIRDIIVLIFGLVLMLAFWPFLRSGTYFEHIVSVGEVAKLDGVEVSVTALEKTEDGIEFTISVYNRSDEEFFQSHNLLCLYNNKEGTTNKDSEYAEYFEEIDGKPEKILPGEHAQWTVRASSEKKISYLKMMFEKDYKTAYLFVIDAPKK